jgi:hypothetical protein
MWDRMKLATGGIVKDCKPRLIGEFRMEDIFIPLSDPRSLNVIGSDKCQINSEVIVKVSEVIAKEK